MRKIFVIPLTITILVLCGFILFKNTKVNVTNTSSQNENSVLSAFTHARNNIWGKVKSTTLPSVTPTPTKTPLPIRTPKPTIIPSPTKTPGPASTAIPIPTLSAGTNVDVYITYYGWNDNDPPGTDIAYPKSDYPASVHNSAGGLGSFSDPVSFASDPKLFPMGTIIYVPYIKKYAVMEDYCATCVRDNNQGKKHIDIWAGGKGSNEAKLIACEEDWTRDVEKIESNPPAAYEVNIAPIFDSESALCLK